MSPSLFLLVFSLSIQSIFSQYTDSPLEQYAFAKDPLFSWTDLHHEFVGATNHGVYTAHVINMTSGSFLNESIVDHVIWWHHIVIIIPNPTNGPPASLEKAFFWTACADPGSNTHPSQLPNEFDLDVLIAAEVSTQANLIGFVIYTNPNEPILFYDDPAKKHRSTDALLAYSLHESMFLGYPPLFFPMVRANVRALDALIDYTSKRFKWNLKEFAAGGGSKWGWLTWLWAAVDDRVVAFVPVVFDMLNWNINAHHQYKSYGGWTWAFQFFYFSFSLSFPSVYVCVCVCRDYWEEGLTAYLDTDMEANVFAEIDPYVFRENYAGKPKYVLHNGRDEFFMADDTWFWWNDMAEPKWTLLVPNTEHAGVTGLMETLPAVATWAYAVLMLDDYEKIIPKINWTLDHDTYTINAQTNVLPMSSKIWYTESCRDCNGRRDFRALNLDSPCPSGLVFDGDKCYNLNSVWLDEDIEYVGHENGMFEWKYTLDGESKLGGAYRVFFMDFKFNVSESVAVNGVAWPFDDYGIFEMSTECMVSNNTFPFDDCSGLGCNGTLV